MATVGQPLTAPEAGWQRIDDANSNITYSGSWRIDTDQSLHNGSHHVGGDPESIIKFNFTGTRLRLICTENKDRSPNCTIEIDGIPYQYSEGYSSLILKILVFEKLDLLPTEHTVEILHYNDAKFLTLDAIDIDETSELLPYNPIPEEVEQAILRITMNDSSEREYKVSKAIADDFVSWCNRTIGTGSSCYVFDKGIQNSKEHLLYEKIISFEVIPVE